MKNILAIITLFFLFCFHDIKAQEKKWTLEDCINYAVTNNITLQRQRLQTEIAQVNYSNQKWMFCHLLNAGYRCKHSVWKVN